MAKRELKEDAQDALLFGLRCGYSTANEEGASAEKLAEMRKQMIRVAKMFGYDDWPGSFGI